MNENNYKFETLQTHAGQEQADPFSGARAVPIYQTTSYVFDNCCQAAARFASTETGNVYGRLTNSTVDVFEKRVAALEGGVSALGLATGAAAIAYIFMSLAQAGDNLVASRDINGATYNFMEHTLPKFGITSSFVNAGEDGAFEAAINDRTRALFIETVANPNAALIDIEAVAKIAHRHQIPLIVDNTFATAYLVRPIEYGADIVVQSATKFIGGHGTAMGGVIVDSGKFDWATSKKFPAISEPSLDCGGKSFVQAFGNTAFLAMVRAIMLHDTGATLAPVHAFLFLQGLETLSLRVERHGENALKVVDYLSKHPLVESVSHPSLPESSYNTLYKRYFPNGGISVFTFDIKGGEKAAFEFIDSLKLFSLLANVADVKSLVIHPASTTHAQLTEQELAAQNIHPGTIRLSIGIENIEDIIGDLEQAFNHVKQHLEPSAN